MIRPVLATAVLLAGMGGAAHAEGTVLALDGVWGNEAGCKFEKEQLRTDESMMVLRPTGVESYATLCDWVQVWPGNGAQVAVGLCGYEGEAGLGSETFVIAPDMADPTLMKIYSGGGGGDPWGEVRKCP